jgi:DNA recombination protein RmuC
MHTFIYDHYPLLIAAGTGMLLGGFLAGWLVHGRVKHRFAQVLAAARTELSVLREKRDALEAANGQLERRISEWRAEVRRQQQKKEELQAHNAALDERARQIPALEKTLAETRGQYERLQVDLRQASAALAKARERGDRLDKVEQANARKDQHASELRQQLAQQEARLAELSAILDEERKQAAEKIALLNGAREQLKLEFQNLAQRIFEEKSHTFVDQNRDAVDRLIRPLREQIGDFKKRVEDVYDKETRDRTTLHAEINHLKELNRRISKEAVNLTRALKGDSKARGNWGEVVLERVLEASGLQKGREYDVQVSLKDRNGKRYQPDAVVRLPEGKDVIVDAKVSLKAYEAFYNAEAPDEKERYLAAHIDALRNHIRSLSEKRYDALEGVRSLDFTLMFIPIEPAFLAAVEREGKLFSEAFEKGIVVVSPSTLLVTLRTIQNIWRHEYQNRHALEIAQRAGGLYDKFVGFVEALEEVGSQLDRARKAYRTAHDRLAGGRGNLIRRTQQLKELGAKAAKALPATLLASVAVEEGEGGDGDQPSSSSRAASTTDAG